jgi:two-component system, NtrC family, response regulator
MTKGNILIIDDEEELRKLIARLLTLEEFKVQDVANGNEALKIMSSEDFHVVITDVKLPDINGLELISKLKKNNPFAEVIVLTAYGTIEDGVKAIKEGAFDYITKGDEDNKIVPLVERAFDKSRLNYRIEQLEKRVSEKYNFDNIIGSSKKILEAVEVAKKVSQTNTPVLLYGETGTGKEIFAQSIHNEGPRKKHPFVAINCSAFAKELLESEMFGYKAGAFTGALKNKKGLFEEAHLGTIFLDEIGEMDIALQAKLLRVLESNSFIKQGDTKPTNVDVRIIAATNRNLEEEIEKGNFRADLYYRISVMKIEIPSLRNRREDILEFAEFFIKDFTKKLNRNITSIDPEYLEILKRYDYPGNIREMKNIIERTIILTEGEKLKSSTLPQEIIGGQNLKKESSEHLSLDEMEKNHIIKILEKVNGNKTKAAEVLGIGLTTLYRKLQTYGLE